MKEIVFEYEDLVIIDDMGCLTAVLIKEDKPKVYHINLLDWIIPTNEDIISVIEHILNDTDIDIKHCIECYKKSDLYKNTDIYENEREEY